MKKFWLGIGFSDWTYIYICRIFVDEDFDRGCSFSYSFLIKLRGRIENFWKGENDGREGSERGIVREECGEDDEWEWERQW